MNIQIKRQQEAGFTMVELLIALGLSALLSAALIQIVIGNKKNVQLTDSYAKVQESSRYALDYLAKDFRMAGYLGCVNRDMESGLITSLLRPTDTEYKAALHSFANPIRAIDNYSSTNTANVTTFTNVSNTPIKPVNGTDVFISSSALATDLLSSNNPVTTDNFFNMVGPANQINVVKKGSLLMITNCNEAHIFSVSYITYQTPTTAMVMHDLTVNPGIDNTQVAFNTIYEPGSQVLVMNTTVYFIGASIAIPGQNSLYRASTINGGLPEELVPYIEDMQLLYGVDIDKDLAPDKYLTAADIAAQIAGEPDPTKQIKSADIYSVNISVIATGEPDVDSKPLSGLDNAGNAYKNDGKLRKRYSRLVNIRNAGIQGF